ncbi:MAG TPA: AraC family transcriptional regulator [Ktedonobacteraceae bacterium]|nr:AraC family transcriptional regulator [Ktedonobacteraceae bacterium]
MKNQSNPPHLQEQTRFWYDPLLKNLELLRATYITHAFAPHMHEGYAIGVIDRGAEHFRYRGSTHIAPQGSVVVINPGEMHTGAALLEQGWSYRMLYPDASLLQRATTSLANRAADLPFFPEPVIHDPDLARLLSQLHTTLTTSTSTLERESQILWTLAHLIMRHADTRPLLRPSTADHASIRKVRLYLEEHYSENISLEQLSAFVNLSPFHLLRVFRDAIGLPPHSYLTHIRVMQAKRLIAATTPLAEVASVVGFTDQSHLTRHFKSLVGVTPGQYARSSTR